MWHGTAVGLFVPKPCNHPASRGCRVPDLGMPKSGSSPCDTVNRSPPLHVSKRVFAKHTARTQEDMMRKYLLALACSVVLAIGAPVAALADVSPTTGQPGSSAGNTCPGTAGTPGGSASALGSTFNPTSASVAGSVYAGNTGSASLANSNSTAAVSQYDAACFRP